MTRRERTIKTEMPTLTYDIELGPGYFVQANTDFLRSENFSALAKVVYLVLCSYAGAGDTAWPGQRKLCRECQTKSLTTLGNALNELRDGGLIAWRKGGQGHTNYYHIYKFRTRPAITPPDNQNMEVKTRRIWKSRQPKSEMELDTTHPRRPEIDSLPADCFDD